MNRSHTDRLSAAMRGSRNFVMGGGGGGPRQPDKKKKNNSDSVVCLFLFFAFFLVFVLFYRSQMFNFKEKFIIFQGSGGAPNFSRGGWGGGNCLLPIETHITCDFPGGSGPPGPPLWIRTWLRSI